MLCDGEGRLRTLMEQVKHLAHRSCAELLEIRANRGQRWVEVVH